MCSSVLSKTKFLLQMEQTVRLVCPEACAMRQEVKITAEDLQKYLESAAENTCGNYWSTNTTLGMFHKASGTVFYGQIRQILNLHNEGEKDSTPTLNPYPNLKHGGGSFKEFYWRMLRYWFVTRSFIEFGCCKKTITHRCKPTTEWPKKKRMCVLSRPQPNWNAACHVLQMTVQENELIMMNFSGFVEKNPFHCCTSTNSIYRKCLMEVFANEVLQVVKARFKYLHQTMNDSRMGSLKIWKVQLLACQ